MSGLGAIGLVLAHLVQSYLCGYTICWFVRRLWSWLPSVVGAAAALVLWGGMSVVVGTAATVLAETSFWRGLLVFVALFVATGGGLILGYFAADKQLTGWAVRKRCRC